jgi:hypothetical protein
VPLMEARRDWSGSWWSFGLIDKVSLTAIVLVIGGEAQGMGAELGGAFRPDPVNAIGRGWFQRSAVAPSVLCGCAGSARVSLAVPLGAGCVGEARGDGGSLVTRTSTRAGGCWFHRPAQGSVWCSEGPFGHSAPLASAGPSPGRNAPMRSRR